MPDKTNSLLSPTGYTNTSNDMLKSVESAVNKIKSLELYESNSQLHAFMWSFREEDGTNVLSLELRTGTASTKETFLWGLNITAVGENDFTIWDEPDVADMCEAIHYAGLIAAELGASVIVGRHRNELNPMSHHYRQDESDV